MDECLQENEAEFIRIRIPIRMRNTDDPKDTVLRRFAVDWIKSRVKNIGIDARHEDLPIGTSWWDRRKETPVEVPVVAALVISWWPKPELTEMERDERDRHKERARVRRESRESSKG